MKLRPPNVVEIDIMHQQLTAVALGIGWSITSVLCLAAMPALVDQLRIEPLTRGKFSRHVQVVGRTAELGNLAEHTAQMAREVLTVDCLVPLYGQLPWVEDLMK